MASSVCFTLGIFAVSAWEPEPEGCQYCRGCPELCRRWPCHDDWLPVMGCLCRWGPWVVCAMRKLGVGGFNTSKP
eukprot:3940626-Rhodomonas_salina.1